MTVAASIEQFERPRLWPYRLFIIALALDLLAVPYLYFGHWAVTTTVSGGTPQLWLFALTFPLGVLSLLSPILVAAAVCAGMSNWRDRFIALLPLLFAITNLVLLLLLGNLH